VLVAVGGTAVLVAVGGTGVLVRVAVGGTAVLVTVGGTAVLVTVGGTLVTSTPGTQLTYGNLVAGTWYTFRYTANMSTAGSISGNAAFYPAVPEPATWGMMLLGFAGMGLAIRRRRRPALAQIA